MIAVWVVRILLWAGIVAVATGSLGILFARTVFDRLHYAGGSSRRWARWESRLRWLSMKAGPRLESSALSSGF